MAKQNDAGVYKLKNGNWGYRYVVMVNGVRKEARKTKDEFGTPFKTKREAMKARQAAIDREQPLAVMIGLTTPSANRTACGKTTSPLGSAAVSWMKSARRRWWTI